MSLELPQTIAIAGAGLAGRLMAWRLSQLGCDVSLFDKAEKNSFQPAAMVAAAMLAPVSEALVSDELVYRLGMQSLKLWPLWLNQLTEQSGVDIGYQQQGSIIVAHQQDATELVRFEQRVKSKNYIAEDQLQRIDNQTLQTLEPELRHFDSACYLPGEGCLHNWQLFAALEKQLDSSVRWLGNTDIEKIEAGRLCVNKQWQDFDLVLDCRGFGAKNSFVHNSTNSFHDDTESEQLRGVRGEVLWVRAPEVAISRPVRLMHPRYQLYIAPKGDGLYVIGATEIESESMKPVTVRSNLELMSALYAVHKGFAEATLEQSLVNLRPAFFDNQPKIFHQQGLMQINGLYRHGFLIAPAIVESAIAMLRGEQSAFFQDQIQTLSGEKGAA